MTQEANAPKLSITSIAARTACPVCVALKEFQSLRKRSRRFFRGFTRWREQASLRSKAL